MRFLGGFWKVFRMFLECCLKVFGKFLGGFWTVFGMFLGGFQEVFGRFLMEPYRDKTDLKTCS